MQDPQCKPAMEGGVGGGGWWWWWCVCVGGGGVHTRRRTKMTLFVFLLKSAGVQRTCVVALVCTYVRALKITVMRNFRMRSNAARAHHRFRDLAAGPHDS